MAKYLKVRYTVVDGTLPNGLTLNPDTGILEGSVGFDALGQGPAWQGPDAGSIGAYNEGDTINTVTFNATTTKTPVVFSLATSNDKLPWGLTFDPVNGTISGTLAMLKQRQKEAGVTFDGPAWNTQFGKLAGYDEGFTASISLSATPVGSRTITKYDLVDGYLPWGLTLNPATGVISGTVATLKNPGAFVDVPKLPIPVWNNVSDSLGTIHETESSTFQVSATPAAGRSMAKYVIRSGALPFGFTLNQSNGQITGAARENLVRNDSAYYDASKDPVFSDTVVINSQNTTLASGGSLGTFSKGTAVTAIFSAAPTSGRTMRKYWVSSGTLPFGLSLNGATGTISGTIKNNSTVQAKTYNFTISASDKDGSFFLTNQASRNYTITVQ